MHIILYTPHPKNTAFIDNQHFINAYRVDKVLSVHKMLLKCVNKGVHLTPGIRVHIFHGIRTLYS